MFYAILEDEIAVIAEVETCPVELISQGHIIVEQVEMIVLGSPEQVAFSPLRLIGQEELGVCAQGDVVETLVDESAICREDGAGNCLILWNGEANIR